MVPSQLINRQRLILWLIPVVVLVVCVLANPCGGVVAREEEKQTGYYWTPPSLSELSDDSAAALIRYGHELVANTSLYLGPSGTVAALTNGMNCQNCHLEAGTRTWGNNYSAVFSTYPRFRERSGTVENIFKRISDCIERSLNGRAPDSSSREMQAIASYINWLGKSVPKNVRPSGVSIRDLPFPDRAADLVKGRKVFVSKCERCHGANGEGLRDPAGPGYTYPPLWGANSYNTGAGLFRLSRFAGFVRDNMPFDAPYNSRPLTDEEAWDVAAFVNSQPRPSKDVRADYPKISGKPVDYPFGPFADAFSADQHKYGPFEPIRLARKK